MKLFDRYIFTTVLLMMVGTLGIIVALDVVFSYVAELEDVEGNYTARDALWYVICTSPRRAVEHYPFAALLGALLGMGSLASNSELVVMRAAGISTYRLVASAGIPVFVCAIAGLMASEFAVPKLEQYAEGYRALHTGEGGASGSRVGYWYREGNTFIKVNAILPGGVMVGVSRFEFDEEGKALKRVSFAEQGRYVDQFWLLQNLQESRLYENRIEVNDIEAEPWFATLTPDLLKIVSIDPEFLSLRALVKYLGYLKAQNLQTQRYALAFWRKISQPLASLALAFVAVSFVFGPLRSVTMGLRVTAGIVVGLVFHYSQQALGYVGLVYPVSPVMASMMPIVLCAIVGLMLIRRVR